VVVVVACARPQLKKDELRRSPTQVFVADNIKFPLPHRVLKTEKKFKKTFAPSRPNTTY